jgi:putative ABC transport system permease protein
MNLVGFAIRNLQRRPLRTSLSIFSIGLAVGSALALIAISRSIEDNTQEGKDEMGDDVIVTQRGAIDIFGGFLPQQIANQIARVPGVARASGELFLFAPSEKSRHVLVYGWPENSYLWKSIPLREGRIPAPGERQVAVIGDNIAEGLAKSIGDMIELQGEKFRVIGIAKYTSLVNRSSVDVLLPDLQEVTYRHGQISLVHIKFNLQFTAAEIARVKQDVEAVGRVSVSTVTEVLKNDHNLSILKAVSLAISIIALTMGALNVLNSLLMATQERTREIGIISALGWSDAQIMSSIVIEGLLMCGFGCALGIFLCYLTSFLFPLIPTIGNLLSFKPSLGLILPTVVSVFALCAIGALYPAWRAIRVPPAVALRHL